MKIARISLVSLCRNVMEIPLTEEQYLAGMRLREDGVLIQNAFPTLSPVQREFLMTGMSEDEQAEFFAGEES
jgi:hypothetical protein